MAENVDVLAVMASAKRAAVARFEDRHQWREKCRLSGVSAAAMAVLDADCKEASEAMHRAHEAHAALADLLREADIVADALEQDGRTSAGMRKEVAAKRLRAALARVQP